MPEAAHPEAQHAQAEVDNMDLEGSTTGTEPKGSTQTKALVAAQEGGNFPATSLDALFGDGVNQAHITKLACLSSGSTMALQSKDQALQSKDQALSVSDMDLENIMRKITSNCTSLDEILAGDAEDSGIESGAFIEFFGEARMGKTHICHTLCVTAQMVFEDGDRVLFIDTASHFRSDLLMQIAGNLGMETEATNNNITVIGVSSSSNLTPVSANSLATSACTPSAGKCSDLQFLSSVRSLCDPRCSWRWETT